METGAAQLDYTSQSGGKAGIWQSGMGISVDAATSRIFIVTGYVFDPFREYPLTTIK